MSEELTPDEEHRRFIENHRKSIQRHIGLVIDNCSLLGERIIEQGGQDYYNLGLTIVANGYMHDNSKLTGIEWLHLTRGGEQLELAHQQHVATNPHHPEYWTMRGQHINDMPPQYIAEMVCDVKARSSEFGTDVRTWLKDTAPDKWGYSKKGKFYKSTMHFLDLLLDQPFESIAEK